MKLLWPINFIGTITMSLDEGYSLSIEEVEQHIERGDLIPFLRENLSPATSDNLSRYSMEISSKLNQALYEIQLVYQGKERRKFGIENNGLCLLLAWTMEVVFRNVNSDTPVKLD